MAITAIVGEQRGDEGKGRFVDMLAAEHDIVARYNGGPNAGHTVVLPDNTELALHGIPSGIAHPNIVNVIGQGVLVNAAKLPDEISRLKSKGINLTPDNFMISSAAHLILPHHISQDEVREGGQAAQGSTKSGIAFCASEKYLRIGLQAAIINNDPQLLFETVEKKLLEQRHVRVEEWLPAIDEEATALDYVEAAQELGKFVTDAALYLDRRLAEGATILAEGAQGLLLDIDSGEYPDVSSSHTTAGGIANGLGIGPGHIGRVLTVTKALPSHVGEGPFATEIHDPKLLARLHGDITAVDAERGTTTGRTRRLGYLDLPVIRRSNQVNRVKNRERAITKLDWVPRYGNELLICVAYERKGKEIQVAPDSAYKHRQCTPIYERLPNWEEDIQDVRKFEKLPINAQNYIHFLEDQLPEPITMIGVGPRRDQVIIRD